MPGGLTLPTEFLNAIRGSLYFIVVLHCHCILLCCVAVYLGVFYSYSLIRKLRGLRGISAPRITPTEFLITIMMIIVKFRERASKVLHQQHSFVWC